MNHFVERLPWRIAAMAGLVVGAASLWAGTDFWISLLRVGGAFAAFGLAGLGLRALLRQGPPPPEAPDPPRGRHVDQTTPPMSIEDVTRPPNSAGRGGDESKQ